MNVLQNLIINDANACTHAGAANEHLINPCSACAVKENVLGTVTYAFIMHTALRQAGWEEIERRRGPLVTGMPAHHVGVI